MTKQKRQGKRLEKKNKAVFWRTGFRIRNDSVPKSYAAPDPTYSPIDRIELGLPIMGREEIAHPVQIVH
jgi:hypothetical protein